MDEAACEVRLVNQQAAGGQAEGRDASETDGVADGESAEAESCAGTSRLQNISKDGELREVRAVGCRWSNVHGEILKWVYQQFGNDREFIVRLFPGFSKRLLYRKIGETKSEVEDRNWLYKNDQILVKAILKGATDWEKIRKRYFPRKSLNQVLNRVSHIKEKLNNQKRKLDKSGLSLGKNNEEVDSLHSTKHTEKTGEDYHSLRSEQLLHIPIVIASGNSCIARSKEFILQVLNETTDDDTLTEELRKFSSQIDQFNYKFDWQDKCSTTVHNSFFINEFNDLDLSLDPS